VSLRFGYYSLISSSDAHKALQKKQEGSENMAVVESTVKYGNIEEICRKMAKPEEKPNLPKLRALLQVTPFNQDNIKAWCKCFFLIARLNSVRKDQFRSIFMKKLEKIDSKDATLIRLIKQNCSDPEVKETLRLLAEGKLINK
jgi:hypothetical protein